MQPEDTVDGSGVLVELAAIDEQFRKAWMPFFCSNAKRKADLNVFRDAAGGLTPLLDEVKLPPLSGDMLYEAVQKKKPTAGDLDGWVRKEFKPLPDAWFDRLASILPWWRKVGFGLRAFWIPFFAMNPNTDSDSTPFGQRPLCVLPIAIFKNGSSLGWSSVEAWYGGQGCPEPSRIAQLVSACIFCIMPEYGSGLNSHFCLVKAGPGMGAFHKGVL